MTKINHLSRYGLLALLLILITGYSLFEARFLILGPSVSITNPENNALADGNIAVIEGTADNVSWISLNGRQIFTDENGRWAEKLIVFEGLSIITVTARDRWGRETEERVRVVLN